MKPYLFEGQDLSPEEILDNLEAENCGVEENHDFIKPFTEEELQLVEREYIEENKELLRLQKELAAVTVPIKEQMKPLEKTVKIKIQTIHNGGQRVTEKVYCYPDYDSKLMGLYDCAGRLIGTRPMTRNERQLHINSHLQKAV